MVGPVGNFLRRKVYLEGPYFKRKDWYYLFGRWNRRIAGQSILRSKNVWGSYEWYEILF
ncbi:MAG: hypothetical protein ACLTDG_12570 [Lachnospiraceae bacterium]